MKVYNTGLLNNRQRFNFAIIVGVISSLLCAVMFAILEYILPIHFPLIYVAMAYVISRAIQHFGRGVQLKFSVLSITCFIISIFLGYIIYYVITLGEFDFSFFPFYIQLIVRNFSMFNLHGLIEIACIAYSVYLAYYNSRII